MKWFLSVCMLAGVAALLSSTSCGPQRDFCPTKPPEYSCLNYDGGMGTGGMIDPGFCDGGTVYLCGPQSNIKQCVPCS